LQCGSASAASAAFAVASGVLSYGPGAGRFASDGLVYDTLAEWRRTGLGTGDSVRP
jgi:hypothetical protein